METVTANIRQLVDSSKYLVRRLFTIGENRLELLVVEVQEERERRLHAFFLALEQIRELGRASSPHQHFDESD